MYTYAAILHIHPPSTHPPFTDSLSAPTIIPESDALVAIGCLENVTYNCRADEDDIFWELNGRQIEGEMAITRYRNANIFVEDQSGGDMSSTLTVTLEGRQVLGSDPVPVLCYAFSDAEFNATPGKMFYIIQFGEVVFSFGSRLVTVNIDRCCTFFACTPCASRPVPYVFFMCRCSISPGKPAAELPIR